MPSGNDVRTVTTGVVESDRPRVQGTTPEPRIRVTGLRKVFKRHDGSEVTAVDGVDLDIHEGEFVVLLGPSGCGKTTLLRCIAGLEQADDGAVEINGEQVFNKTEGVDVRPEKRPLSMVFQSYALWPHMSAGDNVAYPLRSRGVRKREARRRASEALEMVGIAGLDDRMPSQMSGGQQQRVALARALVSGTDVVLFDEPLSNVDAKVREDLRIELLTMQRELGFSALYVTHDQTEAMELAHRIAVMGWGRMAQIGSPTEIYERPESWYVAQFIGTANGLQGTIVERSDGRVALETDLGRISATPASDVGGEGEHAIIAARPEQFAISAGPTGAPNEWSGKVVATLFAGAHVEYVVDLGSRTVRVWQPGSRSVSEGESVWLTLPNTARCVRVEEKDA